MGSLPLDVWSLYTSPPSLARAQSPWENTPRRSHNRSLPANGIEGPAALKMDFYWEPYPTSIGLKVKEYTYRTAVLGWGGSISNFDPKPYKMHYLLHFYATFQQKMGVGSIWRVLGGGVGYTPSSVTFAHTIGGEEGGGVYPVLLNPKT